MHPVLVQVGDTPLVYAYGAMLMLGFLAGLWWVTREAKRRGIATDQMLDLGLVLLASGVVMARLLFVLLDTGGWAVYRGDFLAVFRVRDGGLSFHGGVLGAMLGAIWFSRRRKMSFWVLADICAPATALGYAFARVGCLLRGCCYGAPTDLPWAVCFSVDASGIAHTVPSHPTQAYASLASLLIFFALVRLRSRLSVPGTLFLTYLILYSVARALIEILRAGYTAQPLIGPFTEAQVASVAVIVLSTLGIWLLRRHARRNPIAVEAPPPKGVGS